MGFRTLAGVGRAVSVFGSSRTPVDSPDYVLARRTTALLGERGFAIISGGGPGTMQAANQGARDAGALSIGLGIELPRKQAINPYVDLSIEFKHFFIRKVMFVRYASAFVVFPGGLGTLDELFEALSLIQTAKIQHFPLVLVGSSFWEGLLSWARDQAPRHRQALAGRPGAVPGRGHPRGGGGDRGGGFRQPGWRSGAGAASGLNAIGSSTRPALLSRRRTW